MSKLHPLTTYVLAAFLLLSAAGCRDRMPTPGLTAVDSAGVRLLTSRGPGWAEDAAWQLSLDLDVGSTTGQVAFGRVLDVAPRRAGGLWVVDGQSKRVGGFDEEGREALSFGRPGEGPGEFRSIGRIGEGPNGELRIGGRRPVALYAFDASGQPLGTSTISDEVYRETVASEGTDDAPPLGPTLAQWKFTGSGMAFAQATTLAATGGDVLRRDVLVRIDGRDAHPVLLATWEGPAMRGGVGGELLLLQPAASWSPLGDGGIWLTYGDNYEIRRLDGRGRLRRVLRRPQRRVAFTPEIGERFKAELATEADNPATLAMLENAVFPDSLPAAAGLWTSEPDGRLWVGVMDPTRPLRLEEPNALDVFEADGRYLGRLGIPAGFRPTRITADHVYGVWRDELDVSHARRYRIVRGE